MIEEATKLIIKKCSPELGTEALTCQMLFSTKSPRGQKQYNLLLQKVFASGVQFTEEEKAILAEVLAGIPPDELREVKVTVRLTVAEKEEIRSAAKAAGQSFSDYVRERLLGRSSV
jgi:predicted HicB family RNase H-like nuclease